MKPVLFVAQEVVTIEVINKLLINYSLKEFVDETNEADGPIPRLARILGNRAST